MAECLVWTGSMIPYTLQLQDKGHTSDGHISGVMLFFLLEIVRGMTAFVRQACGALV